MGKEREEDVPPSTIVEAPIRHRGKGARYETLTRRIIAGTETIDGQNENGCWPWTGSLGTAGYGQMAVRVPGKPTPRSALTHRTFEQTLRDQAAERDFDLAQPGDWWNTPLVQGIKAEPMHQHDETIEHLCGCRPCSNPDHWITVTRAENTALMQKRIKK